MDFFLSECEYCDMMLSLLRDILAKKKKEEENNKNGKLNERK